MLFQPTNIIPDTRTGIGFGVVDADHDMTISWQVNGDYPVMTAFQIVIMANDTASTVLYDTTRRTTGCPFNGRDALGEIRFFSYTISQATLSSHSIVNGNEYKYTIRQYYTDGGAETSILQSSASVFVTRAAPSLTLTTPTVTSAEYSFSFNYTQAQNDPVEWIRYQIRLDSATDATIIYDSGNIYGPPIYQCTYSGFIAGNNYSILATGQTASGIPMQTTWTQFTVNYSVTTVAGAIVLSCPSGYNAIKVDWTGAEPIEDEQDTWVLYRKHGSQSAMYKLGEFPVTIQTVYDFGAGSGQGPYSYYLFAAKAGDPSVNPPTQTQYLSDAIESDQISPKSYCWSLLDTTQDTDGTYHVTKEYDFSSNLDSGNFGNNNTPNVLQNFTAMPTIQPSPSNYKSGSLTAVLGTGSSGTYSGDTLALRNALMKLSVTNDTLFLKSSKGDVLTVRLNGPVTVTVEDTTMHQPQTVTVPWIEYDDTPASIIAFSSDEVFS